MTTIPALPPASTLTGAEPIETVQSGASVQTTAQAIANLTASGGAVPALLVETGTAKKISALGVAASLTGTELVPVVQGGTTVQTTAQAIASLAPEISSANPTATAGPSVVNGTASTFMTSDSAPAIQLASDSQFGLVKGDGATIVILAGVASTNKVVSSQSGTSYTAVLGDANSWVRFTSASSVTFTIPPNSSVAFLIGTTITIEQAAAGVVDINPGAGVTINSAGSLFHTNGQNAVAYVTKVATNTWTLSGNLVT